MKTIRETDDIFEFLDDMPLVNENFRLLAGTFGVQLEMINCGLEPDDIRGETIRVACQKINRNFLKVASLIGFPES